MGVISKYIYIYVFFFFNIPTYIVFLSPMDYPEKSSQLQFQVVSAMAITDFIW